MAKIVCIGPTNTRPNCEPDDVYAIHDDDVELTGSGYALSQIYFVKNVTAAEAQAKFSAMQPDRDRAYKLSKGGAWVLEIPEEIEVWKNSNGKWCELKEDPKYKISLASLSTQDKADLADEKVIGIQTLAILDKCSEKIHMDEKNNVEVEDLNK